MRYPIFALISIGNRPNILNCVSPGAGYSVKIERFQIKSNVLNLKSTLVYIQLVNNHFIRNLNTDSNTSKYI